MCRFTFTKIILFSILTVNTWAFIGTNYNRKGVVIKYDTPAPTDVKHESGKSTKLTGSICVSKYSSIFNKLKCRATLQGNVSIRAYFPDAMTEVTDQLKIKKVGKEYQWSFTTPELQKDSENTLQILVAKDDKRIKKYEKLQAKLNKRILYVENRIQFLEGKEVSDRLISWFNVLKDRLERVSKNIDSLIEEDTSVLAQIKVPLQVDNEISFPFFYSSFFSGHKMSLRVPLGSPIEGESIKVEAMSKNLTGKSFWFPEIDDKNDSDDESFNDDGLNQYKLDLMFNSDLKLTSGFTELPFGEKIDLTYESGKISSSDLNNLSLKLSKKLNLHFKVFNKKLELDFPYGEIGYQLPVAKDDVPPVLKSLTSFENNYFNAEFLYKFNVSDSFGRIDTGGLVANLSYLNNEGQVVSSPLSNSSLSKIGDSDFDVVYSVSGLSDGSYSLDLTAKDLAGNSSNTQKYDFAVDTVKPAISVASQDGIITNNPSYNISLLVEDTSPVTTTVLKDGIKVFETSSYEIDYVANLTEGMNSFEIVSIDAAGNYTTTSISNIELDTIPIEVISFSPADSEIIPVLDINLNIKGDEEIISAVINDKSITVNSTELNTIVQAPNEGAFDINYTLFDKAGNETSGTIGVDIILKVLNGDLISISPLVNENKLLVSGGKYAARPGVEVEVDGGFFNSETVVANEDGSFAVKLNYFNTVELSATDEYIDRTDTVVLNFETDTTLSGVVKDYEGNPLRGVTILMPNSGQSTTTDGTGTFKIQNPATGDQELVIDGSTIPEEFRGEGREFFATNMTVIIGNLQLNTLEDPIYLVPLMKDGTETKVEEGMETVVTSPHAPGVELVIPADAGTFPNGQKSGDISIMEVRSDRISLSPPDYAIPDTVISLEPSGMTFTEPVELTLPNVNEFPAGMQTIILSKNSKEGTWEVDGVARVTDDGSSIVTEEGQGISHFSEVFAVPLMPKLSSFTGNEKQGISFDKNGLTTNIELPTYKALGKDMGIGLKYNSTWARPVGLITNVVDIPRQEMKITPIHKSGRSLLGSSEVTITGKQWVEPIWMDFQFYSSDFSTEKFRYNGVPNKSVFSYAFDFSDHETGIMTYNTHYDVKLKQMLLGTMKISTKKLFGRTKVRYKKFRDQKEIEKVFELDYPSIFNLINKKNSSFGNGWESNYHARLYGLNSSRVMYEKFGSTKNYYLNNKVISLYHDEDLKNINLESYPRISLSTGGTVKNYNLDSQIVEFEKDTPSMAGHVGGMSWSSTICSREYKSYNLRMNAKDSININGEAVWIDRYDGILSFVNNQDLNFLTHTESPSNKSQWRYGKRHSYPVCSNRLFNSCYGGTNQIDRIIYDRPFGGNFTYSYCFNRLTPYSTGNISIKGYQDGEKPQFNNIQDMIYGNSAGEIIIADSGNNRVRVLNINTGVAHTIAGNGQTYLRAVDGHALSQPLFHPQALTKDASGNLYVATENGIIYKVNTEGYLSWVAGKTLEEGGIFDTNGLATNMVLNSPEGLEYDDENNLLYVADTGHNRVISINMENGRYDLVAGNSECSVEQNDIPALAASICKPTSLKVDSDGNLIVFDSGHKSIRKVLLNTPVLADGQSYDTDLSFAPATFDGSELTKLADGTFELRSREGVVERFDHRGLRVEIENNFGKKSFFQYDSEDRITSVTDFSGQITTLNYSGGYLDSIVDPAGRETSFYYDNGNLVEVSYPDGSSEGFKYGAGGVMTSTISKKGVETNYIYDEYGNLVQTKLANNSTISNFDTMNTTVGNNNINGGSSTLKSASDAEITSTVVTQNGSETTYVKDSKNFVSSIVNAQGKIVTITRDSAGRPLKVEKEDGNYTEFEYDPTTFDLLKKYDSLLDEEMRYEFNDQGNLAKTYRNGTLVAETKYDLNSGSILEKIDYVLGKSTKFEYNVDGLITKKTHPDGTFIQFTYDEFGNIYTVTDENGNSSTVERDAAGNIVKVTDAKGAISERVFDVHNRLLSVKSPSNDLTSYSYGISGQLENIIDANGKTISYVYNQYDQVIEKIDQMGRSYKLEYDTAGNVKKRIQPNGVATTYEHDNLNRVVKKILPDDTFEYAYSDSGQLSMARNKHNQVNYLYEKIGEKEYVSVAGTFGLGAKSDLPSMDLEYEYDDKGNRTALIDASETRTYQYNSEDLLSQITNFKGEIFTFDYDLKNRLRDYNSPVHKTEFDFYDNNYIKRISHTKSSTILSEFHFEVDALGNVTKKSTSKGDYTYNYDVNGQLTSALNPETVENESFTYDELGNRTSGNATFDTTRQKLKEDWKYLYYYDQNGNLSSKTNKSNGDLHQYIYNSLNQLVEYQFHKGGTVKEIEAFYTFDAIGRRVEKHVNDIKNSKTTIRRYVYDGADLLAVYDGNGERLAKYTYSGTRLDDVLSVDISEEGKTAGIAKEKGSYFYLKDHIGSVIDIANGSGEVVQHYVYSSFGTLKAVQDKNGTDISSSPAVEQYLTFTGRELDKESGNYFFRARVYDSQSGRFLQQDPVQGDITNPLTVTNKYIYSLNNPINRVDPTGEYSLKQVFGFALSLTMPFISMTTDLFDDAFDLTNGQINTLNTINLTAGLIAASIFTGGAAAAAGGAVVGALGITNAMVGAVVGGLVGAAVGGVIGGAISVAAGGTFKSGFVTGAIMGAIAGGVAGVDAANAKLLNEQAKIVDLGGGSECGGIQASWGAFLLVALAAAVILFFKDPKNIDKLKENTKKFNDFFSPDNGKQQPQESFNSCGALA